MCSMESDSERDETLRVLSIADSFVKEMDVQRELEDLRLGMNSENAAETMKRIEQLKQSLVKIHRERF